MPVRAVIARAVIASSGFRGRTPSSSGIPFDLFFFYKFACDALPLFEKFLDPRLVITIKTLETKK